MKVLKDLKTSLLLKSFLLENQDYLSISILYYFDFNNPDTPLEEQAMYRQTREFLDKTLLDYAMPKPKAEVLACGFCHNYTPEDGASHVKLKVGESIDKELYVFGERRWSKGIITKPLPFKSMPLDYTHATPRDDLLPNVEDPKHLITSKNEKIIPASFMPIDIMGKKNMKKLGTFDESYKMELWPGFAANMDYSFFNVAPEGQIQEEFFRGGEEIKLLNMHPKKQLLNSYIPQTHFRCFTTKEYDDKEDEFKEVILKRDTLWLFPEIEKGIVIFRGILKVSDEIYSDVKYLNIKPIFDGDKVKTLDEYYQLQKKELDKSVEIDETPFEEADKEIAETQKEIFNIPREIKDITQKVQGKRPNLKMSSAQRIEISHAHTDKSLARLEQSKQTLVKLKKLFGHRMKIDVNSLDAATAKLMESKERLSNAMKKVDDAHEEAKQMKLDALAHLDRLKQKKEIPDELKEKMELDFLEDKEKVWSDWAFDFLCDSVHSLGKTPDELHKLRHLGLKKYTIDRAFVGYNEEFISLKADEWNLEDKEMIELSKGLVIARFKEATLKSLRIDNRFVLGSDKDYELFLSEDNYNFPLFYFKDDLEAHLCDQEAFDICNSLACDDISKVVEDSTKEAIEKASIIFYLKEDGVVEKLPHAKKFDCGEYKNLFELHQNGEEIRDEIIKHLPRNIKDTLPIERDLSVKAIQDRSDAITSKVKAETKAKIKKVKDELVQNRDEAVEKLNKTLKAKGLKPFEVPTEAPAENGFIKSSEVEKSFDKIIDKLKRQSKKTGIDLSDKIKEVENAKEEMVTFTKEGEIRYANTMKKMAQLEEKAKDPIPDWAKKVMIKAGIDPNNPHANSLSREKVIQLYADGKSFANQNLSKLDLSELDLSGIDLDMANCKGTNFTKTNLSGANLKQTNCTQADFTKANFSGAKADMTLFKKAIFKETVFNEIEADMALFDAVKIQDSKFINAKLDGAVFKEVIIDNSIFKDCEILNNSFIKSSIKRCDFSNSKIKKVLFSKSSIDDTTFLYIDSKGITFSKTKVSDCDFLGAKLYNFRILKKSSFINCELSKSDMQKSTIFEALLDGCKAQKIDLSKTLIKNSQITKCDFTGAIAKGGRFEYTTFKENIFRGINLLRGSLRGVDLKICDFSYSNLYGVEFYKTKFYEVKLDGANLKRSNLEGRVEFIDD